MSIDSIRSQVFQSLMRFQENGTDFVPVNPIELVGIYTDVFTLMDCYKKCNLNPSCRTFVSDTSSPYICRLYETAIDTGTVVTSSSPTSQVGGIHYHSSFYETYRQPCNASSSSSLSNRYLICQNNVWQCPKATHWNGLMCINNLYYQSSCETSNECRADVNLSCSTSCNKCVCSSKYVWNTTKCVSAPCAHEIPQDPSLSLLITFDNDTHDLINDYDGLIVGNLSLTTGYNGKAMEFSGNGYIMLPYIDFYQRSFTIECWIYLTNTTIYDLPLFGQCSSLTDSQCLHIGTLDKNTILRFGFWNDDVDSSVTLEGSRWYHLAFVYDHSTRIRSIYVNGISRNTIISNPSSSRLFLSQPSNVTIGKIEVFDDKFVGYIDHLSITHRAKQQDEIFDDATLLIYYSFDCGSMFDLSANLFKANAPGTSIIPGKIKEALYFNLPFALLRPTRLTPLGYANQSISFAFWMKPEQNVGSLLHLSNETLGTGWCVTMLAFNTSGYLIANISGASVAGPVLPLNVWTHVALIYSVQNGMNLYINGTLYGSSGGNIGRDAPNISVYLTVANRASISAQCNFAHMTHGAFTGAFDELRIYSREISASEVCILSA